MVDGGWRVTGGGWRVADGGGGSRMADGGWLMTCPNNNLKLRDDYLQACPM